MRCKCPTCQRKMVCPHCTGAQGARKAKRVMTPEQRKKRALKAITARWDRYREEHKQD